MPAQQRPTGERVVAATPGHDQSGGVSHDRRDGLPIGIVGKRELRQRVFLQRIRAALQQNRLRLKTRDQRQDRMVQQIPRLAVIIAGGHRQVAGAARGAIREKAGVRPAAGLVDAHRQDPRLAHESILNAVPVMRVEVEVENPAQPLVEPRQNPQHAIIEVAEARRAVGAAVMGSAAGHMHNSAPLGEPGGKQHATGRGRRATKHLRIDGVVVGADAVARATLRRHAACGFRLAQRGQIAGIMKPQQFGLGCHGGVVIDGRRQPAECTAEVDTGGDPGHRERMARPIG